VFCNVVLDHDEYESLKEAISRHYWFELFIDELPVWGFVGEVVKGKDAARSDAHYVYTHKSFEIGYNGPNIITVNLTNEEPVAIKNGGELKFSYSVKWVQVQTPFARRFSRYLDEHFFEHQVQLTHTLIILLTVMYCNAYCVLWLSIFLCVSLIRLIFTRFFVR
jgi:transmembrane 9 superfamily member 3